MIERKCLVVAKADRKWPWSREKSSPNIFRHLATRFHLRSPSLIRRRQSQISFNIPTKFVAEKCGHDFGEDSWLIRARPRALARSRIRDRFPYRKHEKLVVPLYSKALLDRETNVSSCRCDQS